MTIEDDGAVVGEKENYAPDALGVRTATKKKIWWPCRWGGKNFLLVVLHEKTLKGRKKVAAREGVRQEGRCGQKQKGDLRCFFSRRKEGWATHQGEKWGTLFRGDRGRVDHKGEQVSMGGSLFCVV